MRPGLRRLTAFSCMRMAATWAFVLSYFTPDIVKDPAHLGIIGLAFLALAIFIIFRPSLPPHAISRICRTAIALGMILCAYLVCGSWPSSFGTAAAYNTQAVEFIIFYVAVAAFAAAFFEERLFERVVWRTATVALWIGVLCCLASRLTHKLVLVSASHGALRMQGTLSEPSAWAPVISLIVLLALLRRSWLYLGLALAGAVLTASPTCLLVLVATVATYYLLTGTKRQRTAVLVSVALLTPIAALFVQTARPDEYLHSHNTSEVELGRLLSGIRAVETDGRAGHNTRFASTRVVVADMRANGWLYTGAGPAADVTYFPARYPNGARPEGYRPNSLWVITLFDFGVLGVAVLALLMLAAAWRMRHSPLTCAILLPFFIASMINSAEGLFEYSFVALGIMLYAFGWVPQAEEARAGRAPEGEPGPLPS
jgi:hypothetical protein